MDATIRRSIVSGRVRAPPSIPMAHRALLAASLCPGGQSVISGLPDSAEVRATISACNAFGADIVCEGGVADVFGAPSLLAPSLLDCTPSFSTLRLFLPVASLFDSEVRFSGSVACPGTLKPYCAYLERLGAECVENAGKLPIRVRGPLKESEMVYPSRLGTAFFSGLLFSLPLLETDAEIGIDGSFSRGDLFDATLDLMLRCKVEVQKPFDDFLVVEGGQYYDPLGKYEVPGSAYLSSFLILAGVLCGKVKVDGAGRNSVLGGMLSSFSASVQFNDSETISSAGFLDAAKLDVPSLGAYLPHAIVLASAADGKSTFENYASLPRPMKRTAGILVRELSKMGVKASEEAGSLSIMGGNLSGEVLEPEGDATAAMCCVLAALSAKGASQVKGADCISARSPGFFRDLASLGAIIR